MSKWIDLLKEKTSTYPSLHSTAKTDESPQAETLAPIKPIRLLDVVGALNDVWPEYINLSNLALNLRTTEQQVRSIVNRMVREKLAVQSSNGYRIINNSRGDKRNQLIKGEN